MESERILSIPSVDPTQFAKTRLDLAYSDRSPSQKLDLVYPAGTGPFPLIVFVHGGGFAGGRKDEAPIAFVFKLVSQGYAVASVEYRRALEAPWPAQIHDVKAALRWLRAHGAQLELNTERLVLCGNSAGATLAQLAAATGESKLLEDPSLGCPEQSSRVDALISWYGVSSFELELASSPGMTHREYAQVTLLPEAAFDGLPEQLTAADLLLRTNAREHLDQVALLSPLHYVHKDFPPALFQHGTDDPVVSYRQTTLMVDKLRALCGEKHVECDLFPGGTHGDPAIKSNKNMERCLTFLRKHLPAPTVAAAPMEEIRLTTERKKLL